MRDPLGLNERLFAWYYPKLVRASEAAGVADMRRELLAGAHGRTLEVGAGSGLNLPFYTGAVTELLLTEPSPHMRDLLRAELSDSPPRPASFQLIDAAIDRLPAEDASLDTVVCTFVLCSVPDPDAALAEVARVLKPGGRFLFLEHVHAGEGTLLGHVQDLVELPHRYLAAGCHPNRRTARLIEASPLRLERCERGHQPRSIPTVRPTISGSAVR